MKHHALLLAFCTFAGFLLLCAAVLRLSVWLGARRLRDEMRTKRPVIRFDIKRRRKP